MKSRMAALTFLKEFDVCEIALGHRLKVVNLSGKRLNPLGVDANILASLAYDSTQRWAAAFMEHPDGIRYPSRKNERLHNFALFSTPAAMAAVTITHRYPALESSTPFSSTRILQGCPHLSLLCLAPETAGRGYLRPGVQ
jgi:RES domain-containing protein